MKTWESGRESKLLYDIIAGRKIVEGRLKRGKFAEYAVGDRISLRRDVRDASGTLHDGESGQALVEIVAIREYDSFLDMVTTEGYNKAIPSAKSAEEAAVEYDAFYPKEDQAHYGVLGLEIKYLS